MIIVLLVVFVATVGALCWHLARLADATINLQQTASEFRRSVEHRLENQGEQIQVTRATVEALQAQISRSSTRPVPS